MNIKSWAVNIGPADLLVWVPSESHIIKRRIATTTNDIYPDVQPTKKSSPEVQTHSLVGRLETASLTLSSGIKIWLTPPLKL